MIWYGFLTNELTRGLDDAKRRQGHRGEPLVGHHELDFNRPDHATSVSVIALRCDCRV